MCNQLQVNSSTIQEKTPEEHVDEVDVRPDASNKKRSNETTKPPPSNKKAKQAKNEDSRVLNKLVRELSVGAPKASEVRKRKPL